MEPPLAGRRALVTGAGSGIGRAIARALVRDGASVAVTDVDPAAAEAVAAEIGIAAFGSALDVTDGRATEAVVAEAARRMGGLDILCANAGISSMHLVQDLDETEWDRNMAVNAKGVFLSNRAVVRRWLADGTRGVIVNTASMAGKIGAPWLAHYSASKFAVVGFTQALAREVAPDGIRVNCVCPGFVRTSMQERELQWEASLRGTSIEAVRDDYVAQTPLGRLEEPEDVADVVAFLCGDAARFVTGEALNVTGGARMD
ncbi:MAG TPA: SDR family NAD(P)-dependent oxidoreductase [Geminicoccus sp.]|nr:SDR family NAD(P)-dependent oxidoreductase [Geminicoccus sp.]